MNQRITKGMILSAGLGTRLLPVTKKIPKPLVPVLNIPNILYGIALLKKTGISDIIINIHHLPDIIEAFMGDGSRWDVKITFSKEPVLLGTGGGVKKAEPFFQGQPFVLVNCDFITNAELGPFIGRHFERQALATMILHKDPLLEASYSPVGTDEDGHLCSLPSHELRSPTDRGIFTGIHILNPEIFSFLEEKPSGINQVLYPALMKNFPDRVFGDFMVNRYWFDTGDCHFLWSTSLKLLDLLGEGDEEISHFLQTFGNYEEKQKGVWIAREESIPADCELQPPVVLGRICKMGLGAKIGPGTVIGDGSVVDTTSPLSRFVSLPRSRIVDIVSGESGLLFENSFLPTKKSSASKN